MVRADQKIGMAFAIAATITLVGCAATNDPTTQQTLVQSKGVTQFLRNEVASRVPTAALLNVEETEDKSYGCGTDANSKTRFWQSGIEFNINSGEAANVQAIATKLIKSFEGEGWDATTQLGSGSSTSLMQNKSSKQEMTVSVTEDDNSDGLGAMIGVRVAGPCVKTDGPKSEEVTELEGD